MGARGWSPRERDSQRDVEAMMSSWRDDEDGETYKVLQSHEGLYNLWPAYKEPPALWKEVGKSGSKQECLDYIQEVWMAQRPESLSEARKHQTPIPNDSDE